MGNRVVSNKSVPEGLGCIIHNEDEMNDNDQIKFGSVYSKRGGKIVNQDSAVLCQVLLILLLLCYLIFFVNLCCSFTYRLIIKDKFVLLYLVGKMKLIFCGVRI